MHRFSIQLLLCVVWVFALSGRGAAQPADTHTPEVTAARDVLLAEYGLLDSLAAGLRQRLSRATGESRTMLAEQLSRLYAKMLGEAATRELAGS